jgi:hypothetical protein
MICRTCGDEFKDYHELALHIVSKKHRQGRIWAHKFLAGKANRPEIHRFVENPDYEETEYGKENREKAERHLSGENEYVATHCPRCNRGARQLIPLEYTQSQFAWRNKLGLLMVSCPNCINKMGG